MPVNVLVVDDSAVMRRMIVRILRLTGLPVGEVYEAPNGQAGLSVLEENHADLLLVNINMPVMDGEEMIRQLRENPAASQLRIIAVSAERNPERKERLLQQGVETILKPFAPEVLRIQVMRVMGVSNEHLSGENSLPESGPDF
jgi:two-component system, chemotaxis family, chemotaxis protein CheY